MLTVRGDSIVIISFCFVGFLVSSVVSSIVSLRFGSYCFNTVPAELQIIWSEFCDLGQEDGAVISFYGPALKLFLKLFCLLVVLIFALSLQIFGFFMFEWLFVFLFSVILYVYFKVLRNE